MAVDGDHDEGSEEASPNEEKLKGAAFWEVLPRVEHDVLYSSEKALNLEMLLIQVEDIASGFGALNIDNEEDLTADKVVKALEFDVLSGIFNSEVKELDDFVSSLQVNIIDVGQKLLESVHSDDLSAEIDKRLQDAEKSLKKTEDVVGYIRMRSAKFESDLAFAGLGTRTGADVGMDVSPHSPTSAMPKEQKDQQRHFLQMLEKSLARELDLEKKLSESKHNEDELKLKLHYAEQVAYNLEESMEMILQRTFESENAATALRGISKELTGKLQIVQFNLRGSILREGEVRSKLEENMKKLPAEESAGQMHQLQEGDLKANLQEVVDECSPTISEFLCLKDKVRALEEQLRESDTKVQIAMTSAEASQEQQNMLPTELSRMENIIKGLNKDVLRLQSRAESAEEKCAQLTKTNFELSEQLDLLKSNGTEKENVLERKLKESDMQLEHARASVEAIEEQQNMLNSALSDMENLIEGLKGKVSTAESRAESAESKCNLLAETNLELNEELGFLRSRLECIEASLNQAEDARIATARDIGIRTKLITDLVIKLAMERERLQLKISALTKQNKFLAKINLKTKDSAPNNACEKETNNENNLKSPEEALTVSATTNIQEYRTNSLNDEQRMLSAAYMSKTLSRDELYNFFFLVNEHHSPHEVSLTSKEVDKSTATMASSETSMETTLSTEEGSLGAGSKIETVRTIEPTQLNFKYLLMAVLALLASIFAVYLFQLEN